MWHYKEPCGGRNATRTVLVVGISPLFVDPLFHPMPSDDNAARRMGSRDRDNTKIAFELMDSNTRQAQVQLLQTDLTPQTGLANAAI